MKRLRVGIVGLGRMACGYDSPDGAVIQTHVKACLAQADLELVVISDCDPTVAQRVKSAWHLDAAIIAPADLSGRELDIVCISSPSATHLPLLMQLAEAPPRLILCEKPLATAIADARQAVERLAAAGCTLVVNYPRRWIPDLADWLDETRAGALGVPLMAYAVYSGGFWNNGSHALDLLAAFLGADADTVHLEAAVADRGGVDPTLTFTFRLGGAAVRLQGVDGRLVTAFEVELLFERARIRIWDCGGIRARIDRLRAVDLAGYAPELAPAAEFHDAPARLMAQVWRSLADHLDHGAPLPADSAESLRGIALQSRLAAGTVTLPN